MTPKSFNTVIWFLLGMIHVYLTFNSTLIKKVSTQTEPQKLNNFCSMLFGKGKKIE